MIKEFDKWNEKKKTLDSLDRLPFFNERQIWFCHLGVNVGFEQDGSGADFLRPILIVKQFNKEVFWGIPLTRSKKDSGSKSGRYYFSFIGLDGKESVVILSQIRLIDAKRLAYKIGDLYLRLATESGRSRLSHYGSKSG